MNLPTRARYVCQLLVAGALVASATPRILAVTALAPKTTSEQPDACGTLSIAPQLAAPSGAMEPNSSERLRMIVLGPSPTLAEPATPPGAALSGPRAAVASSRKTAWMDYMLASSVPAWSLRLTTKSQFEVTASDRPADASPTVLVSGTAAPASGYARFDLTAASAAGASHTLAPGSWTSWGDAGGRSVLLPSPITSMRDSALSSGDAGLLSIPLAAPPSAAGAAAGAASVPRQGQ
jgi:hypothetical protein